MKPKTLIGTVGITSSTTEPIEEHLDDRVYAGKCGTSTAEAAERALIVGLDELVKRGEIEKQKKEKWARSKYVTLLVP